MTDIHTHVLRDPSNRKGNTFLSSMDRKSRKNKNVMTINELQFLYNRKRFMKWFTGLLLTVGVYLRYESIKVVFNKTKTGYCFLLRVFNYKHRVNAGILPQNMKYDQNASGCCTVIFVIKHLQYGGIGDIPVLQAVGY